ncbi:hypothetical protein BC628DRAFT_452286 [Trametes gibbosa]|nr:hypothetical protein BC628DRAFT_452286 [Trametes gibbosa]
METRSSRANTPRAHVSQKSLQAPRRASSVPAVGSNRPEYILDCVLMTPRKRKRTSLHEDLPSLPMTQTQTSRLGAFASSQKKLPAARTSRSRARSTEKEATRPSSRTSSRSRKQRPPSPAAPVDKPVRRRAVSSTRTTTINSATTEPSPSRIQRRRPSRTVASGRLAPSSRTAASASPSSRQTKGKGRASRVDFETSQQQTDPAELSVDDVESSAGGTRRAAKRRRVSPAPSLGIPEFSSPGTVLAPNAHEEGVQATAAEGDFQMLDMPDDASLPWVPVDPASATSAYVPPGLNALIEDMKRALVLQMSARQKAETLHAEEFQRRRELEIEAARLAAANRALEAERSAWTATAAGALASTLESVLPADLSRRRAPETPQGAFVEDPAHAQGRADVGISVAGIQRDPNAILQLAVAAGVVGDIDIQTRSAPSLGVASTSAMQLS